MSPAQADAAQIDVGLRQYMLRVYNLMAGGLALTGLVALFIASNDSLLGLFFAQNARGAISPTILGWIIALAPIGLAFYMGARIRTMSVSAAQTVFWVYAGLVGITLSMYLRVYTGESVARTFFITAAAFAGLSLYGYTTKRDLSAFGRFLVMGLIGLLIAMVVNVFLASSMMAFVISAAGVLIFAGLTAYDTQKIKEMYWEADGADVAAKKAIMGALTLYLDFINLFIFLLQFLGVRRGE
ncbi:Bax inhibitor-1/YccA family protein [Magnetospirillum aberrantis]|uniref:Bax inhibitor-1/YccA family protein n=1 Tax=Magnetospirillum aberrantis SpK TaxID=908842 RepID=A0A7C9QSQ3_9PROT|nr:Bax inhibitor-1/YccA family protein [Magnetospirillum aberrantis]NFV78576.1 Bax inhibitor-1/YccA family protein [Magnetospirillum aberrantis SpK]